MFLRLYSKKTQVLLGLFFVLTMSLFAGFVQPEKASRIASNWMSHWQRDTISQLTETRIYHQETIEPIDLRNTYSGSEANLPELYLFYFQPAGYVLVPADDILRPVLAYSTTPLVDLADMPPAFKWWLKFYASDIAYIRENGFDDNQNQALWQEVLSGNLSSFSRERDVNPLVNTTWNQDWPYNELCPADAAGPGGRVYVGCVATAMAQVMKYWNRPVTGQGSNTYYAVGYGYQSANFGNTTYLWDDMPLSLTATNNPVATLSYHAAVSVNMDFAPDGSGSNGMMARAAFEEHWRYPDAVHNQKSNYSATNWENLLKAQINEGAPMYYSGSDDTVGHAWVVDGYQGTNYFHHNFGWGGAYDGFFYLNNITPGGNNLNYYQSAITGLIPSNYTISQPRIRISAGNSVAGDPFELRLSTYPVLTSWNVTSYQFSLFYDHTGIEYLGHTLSGTISDGGNVSVVNTEPGFLQVTWNRDTALFGGGNLIKFNFRGIEPGEYYFDAVDMVYNSTALTNIEHTFVNIPAPVASLDLSSISITNAMQIGYNQIATMNMNTTYLLPSWNVTHYEFDLGYNPEKVQFQSVVSDGTLSSIASSLTAEVISSGLVHVSFNSTSPLSGLGSLLLKIQFLAIGNGPSSTATPVTISNFLYNNTPIANTSNGFIVLSPMTSNEDQSFPTPIGNPVAYPNPFNPSTTISFSLSQPAPVTLAVYNLRGQLVKELLRESVSSGEHRIIWDGSDQNGNPQASGVYLIRLSDAQRDRYIKILMTK